MTIVWATRAERRQTVPSAQALDLLVQAVQRYPDDIELAERFAEFAVANGQRNAALRQVIDWATRSDLTPALRLAIGQAALLAGEPSTALRALQPAAAAGVPFAFGLLAAACERTGDSAAAIKHGLAAVGESATDTQAQAVLFRALLTAERRGDVRAICGDLESRGAWAGYVPSARALASETVEQIMTTRAFVDPDRWLARLSPDVGHDEIALALARLPHTPLPADKATYGDGARIDSLHRTGDPAIAALLARVQQAVSDYIDRRAGSIAHPVLATRPQRLDLVSWAIVTHGAGHESWHIHPAAWLSGVYYVELPQSSPRGDIEFGPYPFDLGEQSYEAWPTRRIEPQPGMLLLFPSWFGHRTWATGRQDERCCIAFDVVPA